ncbi:MAG: hypothetical protein LBM27_04620, partial [Lactobacillaceae bacterium]|nr:hypothetical protein [Lactobacillaceae bacterium]
TESSTGKTYETNFEEFSNSGLQRQELHVTSSSLIRAETTIGVWYEEDTVAEDWDFFMRLGLEGKKFVNVSNAFLNYQIKPGSRSSHNSFTEDTLYFEKILEKLREEYGDKNVIEKGYILKKRMSELELDRASVIERLRLTSEERMSLSDALYISKVHIDNQVIAIDDLNRDISRYKKELDRKQDQIENLEELSSALQIRLSKIESSRFYRLYERYKKLKSSNR